MSAALVADHYAPVHSQSNLPLATQVAGWLGVDVRMLTAFPTARELAAQLPAMQAADPAPVSAGEQQPSRDAALSTAVQDSRQANTTAHEPSRKRLRLLAADQASRRDNRTLTQPSSRADWMLTQPDPALGGVVLQRGGHISVCPSARVPSAEAAYEASAQFPEKHQTGASSCPFPAAEHPGTAQLPQEHSIAAISGLGESSALQHRSSASLGNSAEGQEDRRGAGGGRQLLSGEQGDNTLDRRQCGVQWRVKMYECVDASPVILIQPVSEATDEQSSQQDTVRKCQPAKNSLRCRSVSFMMEVLCWCIQH